MKIIPSSLLFIPDNRQRREFPQEQLNELAESIRLHGLFHPPVVAEENGRYRLVAGERRVRALASLAELDIPFTCGREEILPGHIPVTLLSELDELTLKEIELEENTIRSDLTWQELARARAALDELRRKQNPSHTYADTAREVFGSSGGTRAMAIREAVILAGELSDPEIAKASSQKEAMKILQRKRDVEHRKKLAEKLFSQAPSSPHCLLEGDFFHHIKEIPSDSFDTIITDPPYGIDAGNFGDQALLRHEYDDSWETTERLLTTLAQEGFRVTRRQAHAFIFCSITRFFEIAKIWESAGWEVWPRPLIWSKGTRSFLPRPYFGPRYSYESILFAIKGQKKFLNTSPDVFHHPSTEEKLHAAQKPVSLFKDLLSCSCLPGDSVFDPFVGSGTLFHAANELKLIATGIEMNPEHIAIAKLAMHGEIQR